MTKPGYNAVAAVGAACALLVPISASAGTVLNFQGIALAASEGVLYQYPNLAPVAVSFEGRPVNLTITLAEDPEDLTVRYVSDFFITWTDELYDRPFLTSYGGGGVAPSSIFYGGGNFLSTLNIQNGGGEISIFPDQLFGAYTDSDPTIDLTYSVEGGIYTGSGTFRGYFNRFVIERDGTTYDGTTLVNFSFGPSSPPGIPEPASWALLTLGLGGAGSALRRRRSSIAA